MTPVTLKDIYDVVNERMDRMEDTINGRFVAVEASNKETANRVNVVENLFNNLAGKVTIGVLVVGTFVGIISNYIIEFLRRLKG